MIKNESFIRKALASIYKKTPSSSAAQFEKDFGSYPPKPLNASNQETKFNTLCVTRLGKTIYSLRAIARLATSDPSNIDKPLRDDPSTKLLSSSVKDTKIKIKNFTHELSNLSTLKRSFVILILTILSPAMLMFFMIYTSRIVASTLIATFKEKKAYGSFLPILNNDLEIIVFAGLDGGDKEDAVKSHEHIHLAQHVSRLKSGCKDKIDLRSPCEILNEKYVGNEFVYYLFKADEIEARLHEIVLSYYRRHGELPLTLDGFIGILAASKNLSSIVESILSDRPELLELKNLDRAFYSTRDEQSEKELAYTIIAIKTNELREKFILEVLPVMYGNLLCYYGDQRAGMNFLAETDRPNLYDLLWV